MKIINKDNSITRIVEEKDCNLEEKSNQLVNAGVYCFI